MTWEPLVRSYAVQAGDVRVLIDPIAPAPDGDAISADCALAPPCC